MWEQSRSPLGPNMSQMNPLQILILVFLAISYYYAVFVLVFHVAAFLEASPRHILISSAFYFPSRRYSMLLKVFCFLYASVILFLFIFVPFNFSFFLHSSPYVIKLCSKPYLFLFCTMTNKCTIISQIITLLHVSTLPCHPQTACNQYLAKLHKYFKCNCWSLNSILY